MKKKRILLTGASGSVGKKILEELYKKREEYNLTLFARGSIKNRKLFRSYHNGINVIWGDILEFEKCKKAVKRQDIIIHAAALIPPEAYKDPEYTHKVNVSGTNNIIKSAKTLNIEPKVIYTSSIAVYGDRLNNPIIKKQDKTNPNDIYGETKVKAENLIVNSNFEYLIFRLSYVATIDTLRLNPIIFKMPLNTPIEIISGKDVALAIANSINVKEIWNNIYNLGGGENCRIIFKDFLNNLLEIIGIGREYFPKEAFAEKGFNCGYISDNPKLQKKLKFQNDHLKDFYQKVKDWIGIKRYFARIFRWFIKKYLLKCSKCYKKHRKNI